MVSRKWNVRQLCQWNPSFVVLYSLCLFSAGFDITISRPFSSYYLLSLPCRRRYPSRKLPSSLFCISCLLWEHLANWNTYLGQPPRIVDVDAVKKDSGIQHHRICWGLSQLAITPVWLPLLFDLGRRRAGNGKGKEKGTTPFALLRFLLSCSSLSAAWRIQRPSPCIPVRLLL